MLEQIFHSYDNHGEGALSFSKAVLNRLGKSVKYPTPVKLHLEASESGYGENTRQNVEVVLIEEHFPKRTVLKYHEIVLGSRIEALRGVKDDLTERLESVGFKVTPREVNIYLTGYDAPRKPFMSRAIGMKEFAKMKLRIAA